MTDKFTAADVRQDCPISLSAIGERAAAHLNKADKYTEKADQHRISAGRYSKAFVQGVHCDPHHTGRHGTWST